MRHAIRILLAMAPVLAFAASPVITNVRASQRAGTKLVDIWYDAADDDGDLLKVGVEVSSDDGKQFSVPASSFSSTNNAYGDVVTVGTNKHIVWDAGKDWDGEYSNKMRVKVVAIDAKGFPGLEWGDAVPPGGFLMGQDGGVEGSGPSRHVNVPWTYWLSKYEITVGQYCKFLNMAHVAGVVEYVKDVDSAHSVFSVMGATNVTTGASIIPHLGGAYRLCNIGDDKDIRWNVNHFEVSASNISNHPMRVTWHGAMLFAHFHGYDLPTEAEWEKAARGPDYDDENEHRLYPWGDDLDVSYANYAESSWDERDVVRKTTPVGSYNGGKLWDDENSMLSTDAVNAYGLYDLCGNVGEWTLSSGDDEYTIWNYPRQDSLVSNCNETAYALANIVKGGSYASEAAGLRLYAREAIERENITTVKSGSSETDGEGSGADEVPRNGFRVCRRSGGDRIDPTCEVRENFEGWGENENRPQTIFDGRSFKWELAGDIRTCITNESSVTHSGSHCLSAWKRAGGSGGSDISSETDGSESRSGLYFPTNIGKLVEVRLWVRAPNAGGGEMSLYSQIKDYDPTIRTLTIERGPYRYISISPTGDKPINYLVLDNLFVDDIELWTVPR